MLDTEHCGGSIFTSCIFIIILFFLPMYVFLYCTMDPSGSGNKVYYYFNNRLLLNAAKSYVLGRCIQQKIDLARNCYLRE